MDRTVEPAELVIIGGGASAALLSWHLVQKGHPPPLIIDPSDRAGFGLAYSTASLKHLLNVPVRGMSAQPDDPDHGLRWLHANVATSITADDFIPRALYGLYLRHLLTDAAPVSVRGHVYGCAREDDGYRLVFDDGRTLHARRVVLALGHFDPPRLNGTSAASESTGRYHHNAWNPIFHASIGRDDHVLLIGTGLTTIDVLLRLREYGHRGRITAMSRHGIIPNEHAPYTPLPAPVIQPDTLPPTALAYFRAVRNCLRRGMEWRAVIDSLRSVTNRLWAALPETEKRRFCRHLQRRWDVVRHRMAPRSARHANNEQADGSLRVLRGSVEALTVVPDGLRITARAPHGSVTLDVQHAVNCTGPDLNYRRVASPLLHSLLNTGEIQTGFAERGLLCTPEGRLIRRDGTTTEALFTLGSARMGVLFESIAIPEIRQQAHDLASLLVNQRAMRHCNTGSMPSSARDHIARDQGTRRTA